MEIPHIEMYKTRAAYIAFREKNPIYTREIPHEEIQKQSINMTLKFNAVEKHEGLLAAIDSEHHRDRLAAYQKYIAFAKELKLNYRSIQTLYERLVTSCFLSGT